VQTRFATLAAPQWVGQVVLVPVVSRPPVVSRQQAAQGQVA